MHARLWQALREQQPGVTRDSRRVKGRKPQSTGLGRSGGRGTSPAAFVLELRTTSFCPVLPVQARELLILL